MTCYVVPATAAIICFFMRKKIPSWKNSEKHLWLNLLLAGGALFGVVDHIWNGEFMLFGSGWLADLTLGITITVIIIAAWGFTIFSQKASVRTKDEALD